MQGNAPAPLSWIYGPVLFAVLVAFVPAGIELLGQVQAVPWTCYVGIFWILVPLAFFRGARADSASDAPRPLAGALLLVAGFMMLFLGIVAGFGRLARFGLPLALIGTSRLVGRPVLATALLSLWLVPVPAMLNRAASPLAEEAVLAAAVLPFQAAGGALLRDGVVVELPEGQMRIRPADAGVPLVTLLAGLGWYAATRRGAASAEALRSAVRWGLIGLPLQLVSVMAALGIALAQGTDAARSFLTFGPIVCASGIGLLIAETRRRSPLESPPT